MSEISDYAVKILKRYALENQVPPRSTSDLSPMEQWLILELYKSIPSAMPLPSREEAKIEAHRLIELFGVDFAGVFSVAMSMYDYLMGRTKQ